MLGTLNYITKIEIIVIVGILIFAVYVAYSLDLFKKG
ncbi:MAG: hypothetical protein KatS3mg130_1205 [Candidatus Sumerlaea sp.]|nr:MAG: hypothetical protein KatS3mg130_1205 [Candidatus Sumerlaea sp.]